MTIRLLFVPPINLQTVADNLRSVAHVTLKTNRITSQIPCSFRSPPSRPPVLLDIFSRCPGALGGGAGRERGSVVSTPPKKHAAYVQITQTAGTMGLTCTPVSFHAKENLKT